MVIQLVALLVELGLYKRINLIFLVAGHTKNSCDRLFNVLKIDYRKSNVFTMDQIMEVCSRSPHVTAV